MKPHDKICASPLFPIVCFVLGVCTGIVLMQDYVLDQLNTSDVRVVSK